MKNEFGGPDGHLHALRFFATGKKSRPQGNRPISTFMIFLMKNEFWGPDGHLHAPRFFVTAKKSRSHWEQANFNFHDFFDEKRIVGTTWAPARASIFCDWKKNPDRTGNRPISTFIIFLMKNELWGPDGHLHAPRFVVTGKTSRTQGARQISTFMMFF